MTELAAHIVDSVIPAVPVRQFVLTLPPDLRAIVAWNSELRGKVLTAFMRALEKHYVQQALAKGATEPKFAAISGLQRWDGAIRIFPHWHVLVADGAWHKTATGLKFLRSRIGTPRHIAADATTRIRSIFATGAPGSNSAGRCARLPPFVNPKIRPDFERLNPGLIALLFNSL